MKDFEIGDPVLMYGVIVGKAVEPIRKGELLSTRNIRHDASPFTKNRRLPLDATGRVEVEDQEISRLSPFRWPGRYAQLLARCSACFL